MSVVRIWDPPSCGGGSDHRCHLRGLPRRRSARPESTQRARVGARGHGQPYSSQGRKGQRELVEQRGCELLCTCRPTFSPELNHIEDAFSKMKGITLRRAEARSQEVGIEVIGRALDEITFRDARSFFEHCGYLASAVVISAVDVQDTPQMANLGKILRGLVAISWGIWPFKSSWENWPPYSSRKYEMINWAVTNMKMYLA